MQRRKFIAAGLGALALGGSWTLATSGLRPGLMTANDDTAPEPKLVRGADLGFGTVINVQVVHTDEQLASRAIRDALDAARTVDHLMSLYHDNSQVVRLNQMGVLHHPHPQLLEVLRAAQRLSQFTDGAFDITIQPLWLAASQEHADSASIREAREQVDWRRLLVEEHVVEFHQQGMAITLNGIAQGYAADQALAALRRHGIEHALVDMGEFAATGQRATAQPWTIGVQHPREPESMAGIVEMDGRAVSTSGDYATRFSADFARHHIIDPRSGISPSELASATVLAPSAMLADGLSTACMVLGVKGALALIAAQPDTDVLLIDKQGRQTHSQGWRWAQA